MEVLRYSIERLAPAKRTATKPTRWSCYRMVYRLLKSLFSFKNIDRATETRVRLGRQHHNKDLGRQKGYPNKLGESEKIPEANGCANLMGL